MTERTIPIPDRHLTRAKLRRVLEKRHTQEEENEILLHLLAACPGCRAAGQPLLEAFERGDLEIGFCSLDADLAVSRAQAPALWKKLQGFSFEKQQGLIRSLKRFQSWGLCELLCQESVRLAADDAGKAVELGELAVLLGSVLREDQPAEKLWLYQLRAYAWAHLGNARRVLGDLRSAEEAFATSTEFWVASAPSMGDVLGYEVRLLDLEASLRRAQRRLGEARELLDRALQIARDGDDIQRIRLLINKAKVLEEAGDLEGAIHLLRESESLLRPGQEPRLELCIRHNLLDSLSKAGHFEEAMALMPGITRLSQKMGHQLDAIRLCWTRGRIAAGLGEVPESIQFLNEVREDFLTRGMVYDAALVTLELSAILAREGRIQEVKPLAWEILPIFQVQDVPRETLSALAAFLQAAQKETLTVGLAERLAVFLARARHVPGLWFDETA